MTVDGTTRTSPPWRLPVIIGAIVVILALVAVASWNLARGTSVAATATPTATPTPTPTALTVSDVYQLVGPSVVLITTDDALGTGVIAADDGSILTANHVVSGGGDITVQFADGTKTDAVVASADEATDTAVLTPEELPDTLVPATLGGGGAVGDAVIAIGNPVGLTDSVSSGVISGLDRTSRSDGGRIDGLIQFDASVNPGSSGGPLLDAHGSVIGIVIALANPSGDDAFAGIGFAVPIGAALGSEGDGAGGDGPKK